MANVSPGLLIPFSSSLADSPFRANGNNPPQPGCGSRLIVGGGATVANPGGVNRISGTTKSSGTGVFRRVLLFNQEHPTQVLRERSTVPPGSAYDFRQIAAGNYIVIDVADSNAAQGLIYDWVVSGSP